jgi:iron(III) transport system permease protein
VGRAFDAPPGEVGGPVELRFAPRTHALVGLGLWVAAILFAGLPVLALVWKAGGGGTVAGWEASAFATKLGQVVRSDGFLLLGSVGAALAAGLTATALAWLATWLASGSRWFGWLLFVLCVALAVTPGPVVGIALKSAIASVVDAEIWVLRQFNATPTFPPLRSMLENQPSPVPAVWAAAIRLFPVAVVVLWPAVRAIPMDLIEAARLDGFGPWGEWRLVVAPLTAPAAGRAVLAVAALALGEVSASKLVNPPGRTAYVLRLFDQMHYGADSTVAALSLLQLALTAAAAGVVLSWTGGLAARFFNFARTG